MRTILLGLFSVVLISATLALLPEPDAPRVLDRTVFNDNLYAAGELEGNTLSVNLSIVETDWRPVGEDKPGANVLAFAETGEAPSIPGPLLRVRQGTTIRATLTNTLETAVVVQGLSSRRQATLDYVTVQPGATRSTRS